MDLDRSRGGIAPFLEYNLPKELIAQTPVEPRDASRLLVVDRGSGALADHVFADLPDLLEAGDLLVVNDSRVVAARIHARRETGGRVEFVLIEEQPDGVWEALARPLARLRPGEALMVEGASDALARITYVGRRGNLALVRLPDRTTIEEFGRMPLPPYITEQLRDDERYQTIFATEEGSAAAPTAGLHFTRSLEQRCRDRGIGIASVTLHVGLDTFRPLEGAPGEHKMHSERFEVHSSVWEQIRRTRSSGGRIVSVGTTVTRVLETIGRSERRVEDLSGRTSLFIRPPYDFKVVGAQITNFHLPNTTLLLMIGAFAGSDLLRRAYQHAILERYRFYSFGDAMLIV